MPRRLGHTFQYITGTELSFAHLRQAALNYCRSLLFSSVAYAPLCLIFLGIARWRRTHNPLVPSSTLGGPTTESGTQEKHQGPFFMSSACQDSIPAWRSHPRTRWSQSSRPPLAAGCASGPWRYRESVHSPSDYRVTASMSLVRHHGVEPSCRESHQFSTRQGIVSNPSTRSRDMSTHQTVFDK